MFYSTIDVITVVLVKIKFYYFQENGTNTEEFLLKTGVDDINERGKVEEFQGEK